MEIDIKKPAFDIKIRCNDEMLRQMQKHYGENLENLSTDNLINFLDKSTKTGQTSLRYFDVRDEQYLTQIHKFYNGNDWNGEISKFDVKEFINNTPILTPNEKQNEIDNMQDYRLRNKIMQLEEQANTLKENYEKQIKELTKIFEKDFTEISKTIQKLKDIAWDRTSKRESITQDEMDAIKKEVNLVGSKVLNSKENNKNIDRKLDL